MDDRRSSMDLAAKIMSFARSMASRYFGYTSRTDAETKAIRILSCHGDSSELNPCPSREASTNFPGAFICGACGCGDKRSTLLSSDDYDYIKLDFPYLSCPLNMPGFSNYVPSDPSVDQYDRRTYIEERVGVAALEGKAREQSKGGRMHNTLRQMEDAIRKIHRAPRALVRRVRLLRDR